MYVPSQAGTPSSDQLTIIASVSADSTVRIWERLGLEDGEFVETQVISCGNGFAMAAALCVIPNTAGQLNFISLAIW